MKGKTIEITIESYVVLAIRKPGSLTRLWCAGCGKPAAGISLADACRAGLALESARRQMANGKLHLMELPGGLTFVCLDSLVRAASIDS